MSTEGAFFADDGADEVVQAGIDEVINNVDKMSDAETEALSGEIATKIQNEMTYPGQVKITVIRETRSVAYAK